MLTDPKTGPLLFAHRGSHVEAVENTLPAFESAICAGADVLEMDVQLSADREVVVFHDRDGERLAGDARAVSDCTWEQLAQWRLRVSRDGSSVGQKAGQPAKSGLMCRFDQVLDAFPGVALNVDIKGHGAALVNGVLDRIQAHAAWQNILLTSFSTRTVRRARSGGGGGYRGPTGLSQWEAAYVILAPQALLGRGRGLPAGQRLQIPLRSGPLKLDSYQVIARAHRLGYKVDFWVVDEPAEAERVLDLGADGIVTDNVSAVAEVFKHHVRTAGYRRRRADS